MSARDNSKSSVYRLTREQKDDVLHLLQQAGIITESRSVSMRFLDALETYNSFDLAGSLAGVLDEFLKGYHDVVRGIVRSYFMQVILADVPQFQDSQYAIHEPLDKVREYMEDVRVAAGRR